MIHDKLYNIDSKGKVRVWWMESEGDSYRTHSGILDGKIVTSEWTVAVAKNVGRSNETTPDQQALAEVESTYENKLARKYSRQLETASRSNIIQPMLAATYKAGKTKDVPYYRQPKLDGVRCVMTHENGFSREGKPFFTVEHLKKELQHILDIGTIFDGELYNHDYKDDFDSLISFIRQQKIEKLTDNELEEIQAKVEYHVYDLIIPDMPFSERYAALKSIIDNNDFKMIKLVDAELMHSLADLDESHGHYIEEGYEGIMLRTPDSLYEHKRSKHLIKHKNFMTEEFEVVDILPGIGNWAGAAKRVVLKTHKGVEFKSGIDGPLDKNKKRLAEKEKYIGGDALCRFQNYTPDGIPRFGVVKHLYGGKRHI